MAASSLLPSMVNAGSRERGKSMLDGMFSKAKRRNPMMMRKMRPKNTMRRKGSRKSFKRMNGMSMLRKKRGKTNRSR